MLLIIMKRKYIYSTVLYLVIPLVLVFCLKDESYQDLLSYMIQNTIMLHVLLTLEIKNEKL